MENMHSKEPNMTDQHKRSTFWRHVHAFEPAILCLMGMFFGAVLMMSFYGDTKDGPSTFIAISAITVGGFAIIGYAREFRKD